MSPEFEADIREAVDDINTNVGCSPSVETDVSIEIEFLVQDDPSVVGDGELFRKVNEPSVLYREKYSKELLVRKYKTEDFNYLAFPWLYPYGRGYDTKITDIKYARLVLQHGYDRRFQGADDFMFLYYYEIMNKKPSWIASLVNNIHLHGELNSNNNETNTTTSSDNNDVTNDFALPVQNVNSSDSTLPVIRVSEMKSFLDSINSVEGLSQVQIEKLTKLLKPFAADVPGTSMHIS